MTEFQASVPAPTETVVDLVVGDVHYAMQLPDAATDYIQKKIATEKQPYESEMLQDMRTRVSPGELVVDVGANVGNHTLYLAAVAGCRVEAFEPNRHLCDAMRASVALNTLDERVRIHDLGVGRTASLARFEKDLPANLGAQKLELGSGEIEVVTLDSVPFAQPVKLLKIDVEGMEIDVLEGARALVERDHPLLYIECIGERELRAVSRWVDALGYSYWDTFNATPTHLFVPKDSVDLESRMARLHLMAYREEARSVQLVASVRQKLTRAYDNEREAKQRVDDLTRDLALRSTELAHQTQRVADEQRAARGRVALHEAAATQLRADLADARTTGETIRARLETSSAELMRAQLELKDTAHQRDTLRGERDALHGERDAFAAQLDAARSSLQDTQQRLAEMQREIDALSALRVQHQQVSSERDRLQADLEASRSELRASQERAATLHDDLGAGVRRLAALDASKAALEAAKATLEAERVTERSALSGRISQLENQLAELLEDRSKLQRSLELKAVRIEATEKRYVGTKDRLDRIKTSSSYLIGTALVASTRSLPATLGLPGRLWNIFRTAGERRAARNSLPPPTSTTPTTASMPPALTAPAPAPAPTPVAKRPAPTAAPLAPAPVAAVPQRAPARTPAVREFGSLKGLRVACIFDEFTYHSFAPECELLQLRPDTWQQQVNAFKPDLVFLESAWRGVDDSWQKKVSDIADELLALIDWAVQASVPTAFWCKEDPMHFARFLPVARLVDHVFTTDIDCVPRYKDALKHDRVYLLPFAAQPAMHHPFETMERVDAFCFAGSYYRKYPERQANFQALVEVARKLKSVVIYDRNAERPLPHDFVFPEAYHDEIRGSLAYTEIDKAYKGYRYGITVNTIKQSQTMFARRAFELMACNTVVVSNFSKGLRLCFGDLVVSSDSADELEHRLAPLCADETRYRRYRLRALRNVLAQHTYEHRLANVASKVAGRPVDAALPRVCLLGEPATAAQAQRLLDAFARQTFRGATLVLVCEPALAPASAAGVATVPDRAALLERLGDFDMVAPICAADYHGPDYLTDLVLATRCAHGDAVTKAAHFVAAGDGVVRLESDGRQYRAVAQADLRCSLVKVAALRALLAAGPCDLSSALLHSDSLLALDEFSFCRDAAAAGAAFDANRVDVPSEGRPAIDYADAVIRTAEMIEIPATGGTIDEPFLELTSADTAKLLPKRIDERLEVKRDAKAGIGVTSRLGKTEHAYVYLSKRFAPAEFKAGQEVLFHLEAEGQLDACTVFVFKGADDQKISQLTDKVGATHAMQIPVGTQHVRLAIRVQGPGSARLDSLKFFESRHAAARLIPAVKHLVVTKNYPSYDDLYRYGFVHARVRAYARAGLGVEVLRLSSEQKVVYREFEGVDVVDADYAHLDHCLASGHFESVLIHIMDERTWQVARKYLDPVRVVVWAHGAEIQPWWRRVSKNEAAAPRDWAKRTSDARADMWREILCTRVANLRVVFISNKQLAEAMSDLRISAGMLGRVEVMHNFIDGELFRYAAKDSAQRKRILSIRPFSSDIYANDLSVEAIRLLSDKPFFPDLHFRIVGDGELFESTVEPLRRFANVDITRGFLTQRQIAALHRDYGVFIVPSRMDSQGVSRDEAMASGLVPVTTRIAAIPEFVDEGCAFLAEPEDALGLARAIEALYNDAELFSRMSAAAQRRVRAQSGYAQTIARELDLIEPKVPHGAAPVAERVPADAMPLTRFAVYGDVNLNIMDGSAIWAASLAETLGGIGGVRVSLLLKARIQRTQVIARLLDMAPEVQLVEPRISDKEGLTPAQAVAELVALDVQYGMRAFVLRGLDLCVEATGSASLRGRIWAYLTDIPQRADQMDAATHDRIAAVIAHSEYILCQTPQMQRFFVEVFPQAHGRTRILPPMIPPVAGTAMAPAAGPFRLCYAGKFAPRWGILELFDAFEALRAQQADAELHVFGDKVHQAPERPGFRETVNEKLAATPGLVWHGAVDRDELMRQLPTMHACWAFRDPVFERETLELSTKALEYASLGVPIVLARSPVNEAVFGRDYTLFAESKDEALALLRRLATEPAFRATAAASLATTAARYTFAAVRDDLVAQGLLPWPAPSRSSPRAVAALAVPHA